MTPMDEYDEYEQYDDEESYSPPSAYVRQHLPGRRRETPITQQAFDWGISGSILAIVLLTAFYVLSPIDLIPDVIPVAGQADDVAAVLAGGGSVVFLAILRYVLRTRIGRLGCLITIVLASIGSFVVFWVLLQLFDRVL
jgi:uncharacterized membrane protein YkvA (DUF1232 family)